MRSKRNKRAAAALGLVVGFVLLWQFGPSLDSLIALLNWVQDAGPRGYVAFAGVYLAATLLMAPASFLQGSAGFLFGPVWGWLAASAMSTGCGTVSFLLARTVLRKWVESKVVRDERFEAVDGAIGDGGAYLVALLRVSPVSPYNVVNYMLGLTQVSLGRYVLGTWLGSIIPVALYVYVGSTVGSIADLVDGSATEAHWVQWVGLVTTLIATIGVTRMARTALKNALATPAPAPDAEPASGID